MSLPSIDAGTRRTASAQALVLSAHDPIVIDGDEEFTAANGVTGGAGTESDPYIIEEWEIDAHLTTAIWIASTTAHFAIRNVSIYSSSGEDASDGITLCYVDNGLIENVTCSDITNPLMITASSSIAVTDCHLPGNNHAIMVMESQGITLSRNHIPGSDYFGISLYQCSEVDMLYNTVSNMGTGIDIFESSSIDVVGNTVGLSWWNGMVIDSSEGVSMHQNEFHSDGITIRGSTLAHFNSHDIASDNLVNDRPIYYIEGEVGVLLNDAAVGQLIVVDSSDVLATNLEINDTDSSIQIAYCEDVQVADCDLSFSANHGLNLLESKGITIAGNTISDSARGYGILITECEDIDADNNTILRTMYGIHLDSSVEIAVTGNMIQKVYEELDYGSYGIQATMSFNVTINRNEVSGFGMGLSGYRLLISGVVQYARSLFTNNTLLDNSVGIDQLTAHNLLIADNWIRRNMEGIHLEAGGDNQIVRNTIVGNDLGIVCETTYQALIYHNNFTGNLIHAQDNLGAINMWDNGYPDGGNFWDDYDGIDVMSGPDQDVSGPDGIGDTPHIIDEDSKDNYPLIEASTAVNAPPIASFEVTPSSGDTDTVFSFNASESWDPEDSNDSLLIRWDFEGDGFWDTYWDTDRIVEHTYLDPGSYNATLQVKDSHADVAESVVVIVVESPEEDLPEPDPEDDGLSAGTLAVIVGGIVAAVVILSALGLWLRRRNV